MKDIDIKATLEVMINKQIDLAKKNEMISREVKGTKDQQPIQAVYGWKGKYEPWLLEPRHIAIKLGVSVAQLERLILDSEDSDIVELWNDYKRFKTEVMLYDEQFAQIRPQIAEFSLQIFDKNASTMTDVILKKDDTDTTKLKVEIERLKKENLFLKNGGK